MIAIIDSGGANIASVRFALERCGETAHLTADHAEIQSADKVILPGVGMAATAMRQLHQHGLVDCIRGLSQPVLGVCLGMQLLFEHSSEGDTEMLGVLAGNCRQFTAAPGRSVPHMGWNRIRAIDSGERHPLLADVAEGAHVYFVHSYLPNCRVTPSPGAITARVSRQLPGMAISWGVSFTRNGPARWANRFYAIFWRCEGVKRGSR